MRIIDLGEYRSGDARIFAGRERGMHVRNAAGLATFDKSEDELVLRVPPDTFAVTSSFLLALLGETIRALGGPEFRQRVRVEGKPLTRVIEQTILEALQAKEPLALS